MVWWDQDKLIGSDGVKRVWAATRWGVQRQACLAYSQAWCGVFMVWGCMSAVSTGELQFIEGTMNANMYCDILKQTGPQGSIPTPALAKEAEGKGDGLAKHVSRPKPYWASVGHPQNGRWRSTRSLTSSSDSSGNLWSSGELPAQRVKAVLENNGGHTKYWHFGPNLDIFT